MKKGFTLVELLVVLIIIGVLVALILPNTLKAIERANVAEVKSNIRSLESAAYLCFTENRSWTGGNTDCSQESALVADGYLDDTLTTPYGESYSLAQGTNTTQGYYATASGTFPVDLSQWINDRAAEK